MALQLLKIQKLHGELELVSGLRIGASEGEIRIGGVDQQVIRHPYTNEPYIPGSSLKGKVRSLLEWLSGAVKPAPLSYKHINRQTPLVKPILQLFGVGGGDLRDDEASAVLEVLGLKHKDEIPPELGPTRLAFWDAPFTEKWRNEIGRGSNHLWVEVKTENRIDRIQGVARDPRQSERVPAGASFDLAVSIKVLNIDAEEGAELRQVLYRGLRLLELDSLGGSGSRGYGKIKFRGLQLDDVPVQAEFEALDPFAA
jgi:CRISPR-associated protein Csm3